MSNRIDEISVHVLRGLSKAEICGLFPRLAPSSVGTYMRRVIAGLTPTQREQMLAAQAERGSVRPAYHRLFAKRAPISPEHIRIGLKLLTMRQREKMTYTEFSDFHNFSNRVALSAMEQGYHDFTLSEVLQISTILHMTPEELLSPSLGALAA